MRTKRTISLSLTAAFVATLGTVLFIGLMSYRTIRAFIRSTETVLQSHQVMTAIEATLGDIVTAESEARGYIITGKDHYLNLYETALKEVDSDFKELYAVVMDPAVNRKIAELENVARARLIRLKTTVATRRIEGFEAILEASGPGKKLMDDLRAKIAEIDTMETELLNQRDQHARALAKATTQVTVAAVIAAVILVFVSITILLRDITRREQLENEILAISEREQRRIGQDLHDGVCQQLTGTALLSRSLQMKLAAKNTAEADEATRITALLNDAIEQVRRVTRGLHPVVDEPVGLMQALRELANTIQGLGTLACRFECPTPVPVPDPTTATHLYRIAQEAVQNAIRHAHATTIVIGLTCDDRSVVLSVVDDGQGVQRPPSHRGMGLAIMDYRARTIGGHLKIGPGPQRGTAVTCILPRHITTGSAESRDS